MIPGNHLRTLSIFVLTGIVRAAGETAPDAPTFHQQVAPILWQHCAPCHRPGQAGPFSLLTFEDARKHARDITEVTARRYMPPWLPVEGPHTFRGDRRLSEAEIAVFRRWADTGAPAGDPSTAPPPPVWPSEWELGKPDLILRLPEPFTVPAEGRDLYRTFLLPSGLTRRRHVEAWELRPGSPAAHHAFVRVDRSGEARRRDLQDPEPGFPGMDTPSGVEAPNGHFASWQPGAAPARNSPGLGWTLEPGSDVVLQFHLQPTGRPERFQPELGLYFTDQEPTNHPVKLGLVNYTFDIPPGSTHVTARDECVLPADADLLGVLPHTHYLGHRIEAKAILPDGTSESLLSIPDWDFKWQGAYLYRDPVFLPAGTRLTMSITFDNSTNNVRNPFSPPRETRFGPNTTDEMAELWFQLLPRSATGSAAFDRLLLDRTIRDNTGYYTERLRLDPKDGAALVHLGRTLLARQQIAGAEDHFRQAVRTAPQLDEAHYYLGLVCRLQNHLGEAAAEFQRTLGINPQHARANGNLGLMHLAAGRPEKAAQYLEAAVRLDPTDLLARNALGQIRLEQGRRPEAATLFREVLKRDATNAEARSGLTDAEK